MTDRKTFGQYLMDMHREEARRNGYDLDERTRQAWANAPRLDELTASMMKGKKKQMDNFKVEQSGWYRTRDGKLAEVVVNLKCASLPVIGYVLDKTCGDFWKSNGHCCDGRASPMDLVEYLGKERPKQKKVVRMAPALCKTRYGDYYVTESLFRNKESILPNGNTIVRWLIDTHSVEVEVPDTDFSRSDDNDNKGGSRG